MLSGGVDANALQKPKQFFGSARKVEEGGSLTIIATALIDTGSKMDDVIFEEFKGTGNLEIVLDRMLVDKRIWPRSISIAAERGAKKCCWIPKSTAASVSCRVLHDMNPPDAMELLATPAAKDKDKCRVFDEYEELSLSA